MATVVAIERRRTLWQRVGDFWARHGFAISLLAPCVLYMLFFFVIISIFLVRLSLTHQISIVESEFPSLYNYQELLTSREFRTAFGRTLAFVIVGTPAQLVAGLILAMLINQSFRGRGLVRSVFLLPVAIPGLVTGTIVAFMLFSYPFGHINDFLLGRLFLPQMIKEPINWYASPVIALSLALAAKVWRDMPISMLILLAGLQSISVDQYEAAESMGASAFQRFFYITIPMIVPAISTVLILRSIEVWKEFIFPFIIAPSYPILGVLVDHFYHERRNPPMAAAIGLILVVLIIVTRIVLTFVTDKMRAYLVRV